MRLRLCSLKSTLDIIHNGFNKSILLLPLVVIYDLEMDTATEVISNVVQEIIEPPSCNQCADSIIISSLSESCAVQKRRNCATGSDIYGGTECVKVIWKKFHLTYEE